MAKGIGNRSCCDLESCFGGVGGTEAQVEWAPGEWRERCRAASRDNSFKASFWEGEQRWVRLSNARGYVSMLTCQ